jgi:hypothetical protein
MGTLSCLNVSGGDIEITFDTNDCAEAIRAKRIISDMLRRGYALLVKMPDGTYTRALEFDEKQGKYIIADYDPADIEKEGKSDEQQIETKTEASAPALKNKATRKSVSMDKANTVAVAPSAGG